MKKNDMPFKYFEDCLENCLKQKKLSGLFDNF